MKAKSIPVLEQVAINLYETHQNIANVNRMFSKEEAQPEVIPWSKLPKANKNYFLRLAKEAITTLVVPDEKMIKNALKSLKKLEEVKDDDTWETFNKRRFIQSWQAAFGESGATNYDT